MALLPVPSPPRLASDPRLCSGTLDVVRLLICMDALTAEYVTRWHRMASR